MNIYKFSLSPKTKANAISAIKWQDIFSWWKWPPMLCCDLLKNSYLCLLNNTKCPGQDTYTRVVICWKIRIFAYWTTPQPHSTTYAVQLWFAEKFVSLLIEQHRMSPRHAGSRCCDLLKNSYLCLLNNTHRLQEVRVPLVVICWKIRIFAYWTTPGAVNPNSGE